MSVDSETAMFATEPQVGSTYTKSSVTEIPFDELLQNCNTATGICYSVNVEVAKLVIAYLRDYRERTKTSVPFLVGILDSQFSGGVFSIAAVLQKPVSLSVVNAFNLDPKTISL